MELLYHHLVSSGGWRPRERFWQPMTGGHGPRDSLVAGPLQLRPHPVPRLSCLFFAFSYTCICQGAYGLTSWLSQPARIRASPVCDRFHGHALPGRLRVPGQLFHWVPTTEIPGPGNVPWAGLYHNNVLPRRDKEKLNCRRTIHRQAPPPLPSSLYRRHHPIPQLIARSQERTLQ